MQCVDFLERSRLDWYICRQILKSILLQHRDFAQVPEIVTGTLYSVLDMKAVVEKLEHISPSRGDEKCLSVDELSRRELLTYCVLEAAQQMLLGVAPQPRDGFLRVSESVLGLPSVALRFKSMTLLCTLEWVTDTLLRRDTLGDIVLDRNQLSSLLGTRATTSRHLSAVKSPMENSRAPVSLYRLVKTRFRESIRFFERISLSMSSIEADAAHLAIIKLDDLASQRQRTLSQRVIDYFRRNDIEPLLCPISERPMTEAIYLRCGKTVNQAALEELVAGDIPESHCCCDEIHIDIQHKIHDCPLISDLAIRHLQRVLDIPDLIRYGDLPTLRACFANAKEEEKSRLLYIAISAKSPSIVNFLLNFGVNPNASENDMTPLVYAASLGATDIVLSLLHFGADPYRRDLKGMTALTHAALNDHRVVVEALFTKMASIALDSAMNANSQIPDQYRERCAEAIHDLWLGASEAELPEAIQYLGRAMELDPENHLYAEEVLIFSDGGQPPPTKKVYVSCVGILFFKPNITVDDHGNRYEGFMENGVRSGPGKITYSDDDQHLVSFDGEWKNDRPKTGLLIYRESVPSKLS